jgi:hypothetical protein
MPAVFRSLANVVLLTSCIVCAGVALSCFGFIARLLLGSGLVEGGFVERGVEAKAVAFTFALAVGIAASFGAALSVLGLWLQKRSYRRAEGRGR